MKTAQALGSITSVPTAYLAVPALTDLRPQTGWLSLVPAPGAVGIVEVPAGSGRIYIINAVDDIGKGFANEYREAVLIQNTVTGGPPLP